MSLPRTRAGSVAIVTAILLPVMIAVAALALEYGSALLMRTQYQRIADLSAYAGASAYGAAGSSAIADAVDRIASLNGIPSSDVTNALVDSPTGDGQKAVLVSIQGTVPILLAHVMTSATGVTTSASAYAELKTSTPACAVALSSSGSGISTSGGASLTADDCAIASNTTVTTSNNTRIVTPQVTYNASGPLTANVMAPPGKSLVTKTGVTQDPMSNNATVSAETAHLGGLASMTAPSAPTVPDSSDGSADNLTYYPTSKTIGGGGCQAVMANNTWTVTCSGDGPFYFGTLTLGGNLALNFNVNGSPDAVYDFSGDIAIGGTSSSQPLNFGPGTYNIHGGISIAGGGNATFGAGVYNLGTLTTTTCGVSGYSICNIAGTMTFAGPSKFTLAGGIYVGGGRTVNMGTSVTGNTSPTTNSFNIGAASDGNSLNVTGSGIATLADATGSGDIFQAAGNILSSGGSCIVLSAASQHDIGGSISLSGGMYAGAGVYNVGGYVALGANNGGNVTCTVNGVSQSLGLSGTDVSFGILAASTPASGTTCAGQAFCVAAGYSSVDLTAPTTGAMANLLVIGPTSSSNAAGATFTAGSTNTQLSGMFYLPNGPISLSGAASVGSGSGQCLELIGSQLTLSGGSAFASTCSGLGGSTTGATALLVQ